MAWFIKLKDNSVASHAATGEAIREVARTAFKDMKDSEWQMFDKDPRAWLQKNGYIFEDADGNSKETIPDTIEIVPVYDTPNRMHVRVPWAGDLTTHVVEDEWDYGATDEVRSKVVLARYFTRKCR